jgi:hypothetical protein
MPPVLLTHAEYCEWYQNQGEQGCVWEYWGWDADTGWVLLTTDGSC